jgi:hypothetical protein
MFSTKLINSWRNAAAAIKELQSAADDAASVIPVGALIPTLLDPRKHTAPAGWLFCDGYIYVASKYPSLARLLGNRYGGDGTTTFAVPDLHGKSPNVHTLIGGFVDPTYASGTPGTDSEFGIGCFKDAAVTAGTAAPYTAFLASWLIRAL